MKPDNNRKNYAEDGFSIVEMIISMVIFMIVVGSIYGLMQAGLIDRNRASRHADVMKNARAAIHLIGRDTLNAGLGFNKNGAVVPDDFISTHVGVPADPNTDRDLLTSIIGGNDLNSNILNPNPATHTDVIAFAYRDTAFNKGFTISLKNVSAGSETQIARLQTETTDGAELVNKFDLFLVESQGSQVAVMASDRPAKDKIDIAPGDPLGLNQSFDGAGSGASVLRKCITDVLEENCTNYPLASVKKFFWVMYKVKNDGTLVRQIYGNNKDAPAEQQIQEMPLAYNVQDMQIRYIMENGTTSDNPSVGPDGNPGTADDDPSNFNLVRQIVITITVQATEVDEQLGKPETVTLTATFSARNITYDAG